MNNFKVGDVVYYTNGNIPIFGRAMIKKVIYNGEQISLYELDKNDVFGKPECFSPNGIMNLYYFPKNQKNELITKFLKNSATSYLQTNANYYFVYNFHEFGRAELVSYKRISDGKEDKYILHFRFGIKEFDFKGTLKEIKSKYFTEKEIRSKL